MPDSIVKTVNVPLRPERAFKLFTEEISDWWPLHSHSLSAKDGQTALRVTIPPKVGEDITETRPDGSTAPWGRVTAWEPGKRFGMRWFVGCSEAEATQVDVRFDVVADGTQVTLVHSGWEAMGEVATAMHRGYAEGWQGIFTKRFVNACRAQALVVA